MKCGKYTIEHSNLQVTTIIVSAGIVATAGISPVFRHLCWVVITD